MAFKMKSDKEGPMKKNFPGAFKDVDKVAKKVNIPSVDIEGGKGGTTKTNYNVPYLGGKRVKANKDGSVVTSDGSYVSKKNVERGGGIKYRSNKKAKSGSSTSKSMTVTRKKTKERDGSGKIVSTTLNKPSSRKTGEGK